MSKLCELTLLYVEDDDDLREQFVRILKPRLKQVYEAVDGLEALQMHEELSPDMMLVDVNIPKVDGLEVIELVRKSDTHTPIVVLSAYSDQVKLLQAMTLELSSYLIKPVPHKKLLTLLEKMASEYEKKSNDENIIRFKNSYFWKKEEQLLHYHDEIIPLTKRERIFFEFMMKQINKTVTLDSITNLIWENEESAVAYSSLSHLLKRLRKKLPEELIENIYGEGYKIISNE